MRTSTLPIPLSTERFRMAAAAVLLAIALIWSGSLMAAQVDEGTAREVASRVLRERSAAFAAVRGADLQLVYTKGGDAAGQSVAPVYFRVFNAGSGGFVIVSGDDLVVPVLGYSTEGSFPAGPLAQNVAKWLEDYAGAVRDAIEANAPSAQEVALAWEEAIGGAHAGARDTEAVNPLVQTMWDQSPNVNAMCPGGSVTGCVATAMAQVMKYHNHPAQGEGFHSYNAPNYGTLSANFGATTYNWGSMPNVVNGPNNAVATLMYHCGVSVDMQYSPQVSGAWVISSHSPGTQNCAEYALKNYFGYDQGMQGIARDNYSEQQWINLLKAELDASRPVIYDGFGSGGGHCFVCDGYDNSNFFHFNWGWGGQVNGYFTVGALNPGSTGTGGGSGGYNSGQEAIIGIKPASGGGDGGGTGQLSTLALYNYVSPTSSTLYYGQGFTVSTNIVNNGTAEFQGDYAAGVFDANSNFYGFVAQMNGNTLPAGFAYNNNLQFTTTGLFSMVPGSYVIAVLYRPTGGDWLLVADNGGYSNLTPVNVINPNDIEIAHAITVSPGNSLTQGGQVSVNLNVENDGAATFIGQYGVALYNLDGSWAQDVGVLNETSGLPYGYSYLAPYLTFGPSTVTVPPGTYLLAAQHNPNNTGWQLTGSSYFANPVFVTITAAPIPGDMYEVNNTAAQAYSLPVNFSGNNATVSTPGSNLHNATDQDFYKVVLPAGTNYAVTARIHDSWNSGNGNSYTVDAVWDWSADGSNWSSGHDDVMSGNIVVNGGGTLWFHVAPYFAGGVGTYLLDLHIQRGATVGIEEGPGLAAIAVHPNPAKDRLTIDLGAFTGTLETVQLLDMQGRAIMDKGLFPGTGAQVTVDVSAVPEGAYILRMTTGQGVRNERLIIAR